MKIRRRTLVVSGFAIFALLMGIDNLIWNYHVLPDAIAKFDKLVDGKYEKPPYRLEYVYLRKLNLRASCAEEFSNTSCYRPSMHDYVDHVLHVDHRNDQYKVLELTPNCTENCIVLYDRKFVFRGDLGEEFMDANLSGEYVQKCRKFSVAYAHKGYFCETRVESETRLIDHAYSLNVSVPHFTLNPFVRGNEWVFGVASVHVNYRTNSLVTCQTVGYERGCIRTLGELADD